MSILIIGGDKVGKIESLLKSMGATRTLHWDSRRNSTSHKSIPQHVDAVIMLVDYLKHNSMTHFKREAKKLNIPCVCARRGTASISECFGKICRGDCPCACAD